jgi:hypothetical protein
MLGDRRGAATVGLDQRVTAGRYVARISCRTTRLKRYRLVLSRVLPPVQLSRSGR